MAERRPGTARERAQKKAKELRAARGVTAESLAETGNSAQLIRKVFAAPTERMLQTEMRHFAEFVNESLLESEEGTELFNKWSGGKTVEDILASEDSSAPQLTVAILHPFARYRCGGMMGRIREAPAVPTVEQAVTVFWDAYKRQTRTVSDGIIRTSALAYIQTVLKQEFGLHTDLKPRRVPDRQVLLDVIAALFSPDLVNEYCILRVNTLGVLNLQMSSGSRAGALILSTAYSQTEELARGVCWKDGEVWLFSPVGKSPYNTVLFEYKLRYTKTLTGKNRNYKLWDADVPAFWGASLILTLGVADGVFQGDPELSWLLDPAILSGGESRRVPIKEEWLERPIFHQTQPQPYPRAANDGHTGELTAYCDPDKIWRAGKYDGVLKDACHKAGYPVNFASHDMRVLCVLAGMADSSNRVGDVQYSIGHAILSDKWTKYMNHSSMVNFQDAILGAGSTSDILKSLSYMRLERDEGIPSFLSLDSKTKIYDEDDLTSIRLEQRDLRRELEKLYGKWENAPLDHQVKLRNLYLDYKSAEAVHYRSYLKQEVREYFKKHNGLPQRQQTALAEIDSVNLTAQVDAMPEGDRVNYDIDATVAVLTTTDFAHPDSVVRLLSASSDTDTTITMLQEVFAAASAASGSGSTSGAQASASTSATASSAPPAPAAARSLGRTPSAIAMPPPPVPTRAEAERPDPALLETLHSLDGAVLTPEAVLVPPPAASGSSSAAPALTVPQPRAKASRTAQTKAATAAQNRSRSASVASTASSSRGSDNAAEGTSSAMSAIDDSYVDSSAFALDNLCIKVLDPETDRLDFFTRLLNLPAKTSHISGWWPGMGTVKIGEDDCCPRCEISTKELTGKYKGLVPAAKISKMRKHIFDCTASTMKDAAMPGILASYVQDTPCPICEARETEEDDEYADKLRSPHQWCNHLIRAHDKGDLCICGYILEDNTKKAEMHLATHHDICANHLGGSDTKAALSSKHFPDPPFSLRDFCFYPDPRVWEGMCEQEFQLGIDAVHSLTVSHMWTYRDDIKYSRDKQAAIESVIGELQSIVADAPLLQQDGRFQPIVVDSSGFVVSKFGYCILCAFDSTLTWTERMNQHNSVPRMRKHLMAHLIDLFVGRNMKIEYCLSMPSEDAEDVPEEISWREREYCCPDPSCNFHHQRLSLRQFCNHIYLVHRAWDPATMIGQCISESDEVFVPHLRELFKNVDVHKIAAQGRFPMKDTDGDEVLAVAPAEASRKRKK